MNSAQEVLLHLRDQYEKAARFCQVGHDVEGVYTLIDIDKLNELPVYVLGYNQLDPKIYTDAINHINILIASGDGVGIADYLLYEFLPFFDEIIALGAEVDYER